MVSMRSLRFPDLGNLSSSLPLITSSMSCIPCCASHLKNASDISLPTNPSTILKQVSLFAPTAVAPARERITAVHPLGVGYGLPSPALRTDLRGLSPLDCDSLAASWGIHSGCADKNEWTRSPLAGIYFSQSEGSVGTLGGANSPPLLIPSNHTLWSNSHSPIQHLDTIGSERTLPLVDVSSGFMNPQTRLVWFRFWMRVWKAAYTSSLPWLNSSRITRHCWWLHRSTRSSGM